GDHRFSHDNMSVKAEGITIGSNINSSGTNFPEVSANVVVTDGELNIEMSDDGGSDRNWAWTRLSLNRVGDLPNSNSITVDLNATKYNYDLGTSTSPVQSGWQRISDKTTGDVNWSRGVGSRDRGAKSGVNNINRDFIQ
ncbi:hypothetical protein, partial [uncultured Algibacter sp.]|uniref:hypothetical protein n=1 Tax=uncultured Algibacter sp. TaxID=298659 RepID=UPI00321685A0